MDKELKTLYRIQDDQVMDVVIANLEAKLVEARKRKPLVDYRENEEIIRALKAYRYNYLELNEENRVLEKHLKKSILQYDMTYNMLREKTRDNLALKVTVDNLKDAGVKFINGEEDNV